MRDLDGYLERIGLRGEPTLAAVVTAHATSIPFENLDPRRGVPVSLAADDLEAKMVAGRRGGYCFEQNLLLARALQALGLEVELMLGRMRVGARTRPTPRTHLVLRVREDGETWHVDVGCGRRTPLGPIPFGPGDEVDVAGWGHRVVRDGPELVLRARGPGGAWEDLYGFVPEPAPVVDLETSSWFTSTYPRSPFVTGLIVARPDPDGTRVSLSDWEDGLVLAVETPGGRDVTPVAPEDVPALLAERFGLPAFSHR